MGKTSGKVPRHVLHSPSNRGSGNGTTNLFQVCQNLCTWKNPMGENHHMRGKLLGSEQIRAPIPSLRCNIQAFMFLSALTWVHLPTKQLSIFRHRCVSHETRVNEFQSAILGCFFRALYTISQNSRTAVIIANLQQPTTNFSGYCPR